MYGDLMILHPRAFHFCGKKRKSLHFCIFPLFKKTQLFVVRIFFLSFKKTQFIFIHIHLIIHPDIPRLSTPLSVYLSDASQSKFIRLSNGDLQCKFIWTFMIEKLNQITQILPYHLSKLFTEWNTEKADTF